MSRVILAATIPCLAIGLTGLIVMTMGRILIVAHHYHVAAPLALALTVLVMGGFALLSRMAPQPDQTGDHAGRPH